MWYGQDHVSDFGFVKEAFCNFGDNCLQILLSIEPEKEIPEIFLNTVF